MNKNKIALGSGFFAAFFVNNGLAAIAIPYYQMVLAVDPFLLGGIFTLPILISALLSPSIGKIIDTRFDTSRARARLISVSGWLSALSFAAIWMVPSQWQTHHILLYLLASSSVFFITSTFLTIAIRTLAFRSIDHPNDVNAVMSYTNIFEKVGSLIYFWAFPLAQSNLFQSVHSGIKYIGWFVGVFLIGCLSSMTSKFAGHIKHITSVQKSNAADTGLAPELRSHLNAILLVTFLQFGVTGCVIFFDFYVIVYFMFDGEIAAGAFWKGVLSTAFAIFGLLSIPVVKSAADKYGKFQTLMAVYFINTVNAILKWWIYQPGMEYWLIFDAILGAWIWTAMGTLLPGLLADLCAKNKQLQGSASEGFVLSKQNQALNYGLVFSFLTSGLLLNVIGFDASAAGAQHDTTIDWMRVILTGGSVATNLIIIVILIKSRLPLLEQRPQNEKRGT